ncbi:unnamed protein product [Bursaphelenchus okinawaensis]|uniref:Transposase IS30-like HTH domain-containing protein n=1 Tax=Bursaphelenchus okinawaensis TaxID=465554 RepID=A0A811K1H6_9BILA|nr:unnamed protein product [Bursaphelenchus okinawaensis]CAG9089489.1 unnamed protein product [Bursaphelenchus okinawaensis]
MLSKVQKRRIIDLYIDIGNCNIVAERLGHSVKTVLKVIKATPRKQRKRPPRPKLIDERIGRQSIRSFQPKLLPDI